MSPNNIFKFQDNILIPLSKQQVNSIKPIFEYKFIGNKEDKFMTVWLMSFYGKIYFVGFTLPIIKKT